MGNITVTPEAEEEIKTLLETTFANLETPPPSKEYAAKEFSYAISEAIRRGDAEGGGSGSAVIWKGELAEAPINPETNWAYYNSTDKKSYIFDGLVWSIMTQDGIDGLDGENGKILDWAPTTFFKTNELLLNFKRIYRVVADYTSSTLITTDINAGDLLLVASLISSDISYDKADSNLLSDTVKDAIDEIQMGNPGIQFDTTNITPPNEGQVAWNDNVGTLQLGMPGGSVLDIGKEMFLRARASDIAHTDGDIVYISGATGSVVEASLASSTDFETACRTLAVCTQPVSLNQQGLYATFGIVRSLDTSSWVEGTELFLNDSGKLTSTIPPVGHLIVRVGIVIRQHATEGEIFISIQIKDCKTLTEVTGEPTGFYQPQNITVTPVGTRQVQLTGDVIPFYRGKSFTDIASGYISPSHPETGGPYFLVYDGASIRWVDVSSESLSFSYILIAYAFYAVGTNEWVYVRETHGLMDSESHRISHQNIGTYRQSGGGLTGLVLGSNIPTERRPTVASALIYDEDLPTITSENLPTAYTRLQLSGSNASATTFIVDTEIIPLSGNVPQVNTYNSGTDNWGLSSVAVNNYFAGWHLIIPAANGSSLKYQNVFIAPQHSGSLSDMQALTVGDVQLSNFRGIAPEIVIANKVIMRYIGGDWSVTEVQSITGSRAQQVIAPAGNFLTAVSTDTTLTGLGTPSNPLAVDKDNIEKLIWKGVLETAPSSPQAGWWYKSSVSNWHYISDGTGWQVIEKGGTLTGLTAGAGMDFTELDFLNPSGAVTMGTPGSLSPSTTDSVSTNSHTHAVSGFIPEAGTSALAGDIIPSVDKIPNLGSADKMFDSVFTDILEANEVKRAGTQVYPIDFRGSLATAPTENLSVDTYYLNSTNGITYRYNGTEWESFAISSEQDLTNYVKKTGETSQTIEGDVVITNETTGRLKIDCTHPSANASVFEFLKNGISVWAWSRGNDNALRLLRRDETGAQLDTPLAFDFDTGEITSTKHMTTPSISIGNCIVQDPTSRSLTATQTNVRFQITPPTGVSVNTHFPTLMPIKYTGGTMSVYNIRMGVTGANLDIIYDQTYTGSTVIWTMRVLWTRFGE